MIKRELFKVEGDKILRLRRNCPKCGDGVFLADHKNRLSCGKCGYTEFKGRNESEQRKIKSKEREFEKTTEDVKDESIESNIEEGKIE